MHLFINLISDRVFAMVSDTATMHLPRTNQSPLCRRPCTPMTSSVGARSPCTQRKITRCHWLNSDALKTVYKSVVLAELLYASPPRGALQPHQIKVGLKHTYDTRFGSVCIKTLTPLRHNLPLPRTPMTLFSEPFYAILNMFFTTSCRAELSTLI